jgi:hypothetical protein
LALYPADTLQRNPRDMIAQRNQQDRLSGGCAAHMTNSTDEPLA